MSDYMRAVAKGLVNTLYPCHCDPAYTERGMHGPGCEWTVAVDVVDDLAKAGLLRAEGTA